MPLLTLSLFGAFQAQLAGRSIPHFRSANVQGLLAYLALQPEQAFSRDVVATLFWPYDEDSRGRKNLRQALYQLRQVLEDSDDRPEPFLLVTRQTIQFNPAGDAAVDVQQFLAALESGDLATAVACYQGELLPGFTTGGLDFEAWLRQERERLHRLALGAMGELADQQLAAGDWPAAEATARRQLALESWRETAHRQLMVALARRGERSAALAQYDACVNALRVELDLSPSPETEALYTAISAGEYAPVIQPVHRSALRPLITPSLPDETLPERLFQALKDAFSDRGDYERFLWFNFDVDIDDIVAQDDNMNDIHFKVIEWFEDRNQLKELVRQASAERESDPELLGISKEIEKLGAEPIFRPAHDPTPFTGTASGDYRRPEAEMRSKAAPGAWSPPAGTSDDQARGVLLSKVESFWIEGVYHQALRNSPLLKMAMDYVPAAVANPWQGVVRTIDTTPRPVPPDKSAMDLFAETNQSLLILGDPGAGKTVMLLELSRDLIIKARANTGMQTPVIFNLSSWANKTLPLAEWIVEELNEKYLIPRKMGQEWLADDRLMLLLDGLDEVGSVERAGCVQAINEFRQAHGLVPIVLTSRTQDYEAVNISLRFGGAVRLRPLTANQAVAYLRAAGPQGAELVKAVQDDPVLQEVVQSPLMLQFMTKALGAGPAGRPGQYPATLEAGKDSLLSVLLETYVQQTLPQIAQPLHVPVEKARQWLSWLAGRLSAHNQTVFLVEGMQPGWLDSRARRWQYLFTTRLMLGLVIGLILWLFGLIGGQMGVNDHSMSSLIIAGRVDVPIIWIDLVMSLLINLGYGFFVALIDIWFYERRLGAEPPSPGDWARKGVIALVVGVVAFIQLALWGERPAWLVLQVLVAAFMFVLMTHFTFGESYSNDVGAVEALSWSWRSGGRGLLPALLVGIAFSVIIWQLVPATRTLPQVIFLIGLPIAILVLLLLGLRQNRIETRTAPNQGIRLSARNALTAGGLIGFLTGVLAGIVGLFLSGQGLVLGSAFGFICGLVAALIAGLVYGGFNVLNHLVLRLLFRLSGDTPRDFIPFLNEAARCVLLYKVGGGYIFIHRLLQEHLARQVEDGNLPPDETLRARQVRLEINESLSMP